MILEIGVSCYFGSELDVGLACELLCGLGGFARVSVAAWGDVLLYCSFWFVGGVWCFLGARICRVCCWRFAMASCGVV